VETQGEEITDFITTNLMSITDGHIMFRQSLANKGIQPAVDSGFSVSRIGGRAQLPVIRELSDQLKQVLIRYHEVERYLAFGSNLQDETAKVVELGKRIYALFNQQSSETLSPTEEIIVIYLVTTEKILDWDLTQIPQLRDQYLAFVRDNVRSQEIPRSVLSATNLSVAGPILDNLQNQFIDLPGTVKPLEVVPVSAAEHETIIDLLREGSGGSDGPVN
jgi:F-type H+-transporting ATPase subunit alpha